MRTVSQRFLTAVTGSHQMVAYATVTPVTGPAMQVPISDGSVTIDRTAASRYSASLTIPATDLAYTLAERLQIVSPYGAKVALRRGIKFPDGSEETVSLGQYLVQSVDWAEDESVLQTALVDKAGIIQGCPIVFPRTVTSTSALKVLSALLKEPYQSISATMPAPDLSILNVVSGVVDKAVTKWLTPEDRWNAIEELAALLNAEVYADPDNAGKWKVAPVPNPNAAAVHTVKAGEGGTIVSWSRSLSRDGAVNTVIARAGAPDGETVPVYAIAEDIDPNSPTNVTTWGRAVFVVESDTLTTSAQCKTLAATILAQSKGLAATLSLDAAPNPALEPGDVIAVDYGKGRALQRHVIDSLSIPLTPEGNLTIATRATQELTIA